MKLVQKWFILQVVINAWHTLSEFIHQVYPAKIGNHLNKCVLCKESLRM